MRKITTTKSSIHKIIFNVFILFVLIKTIFYMAPSPSYIRRIDDLSSIKAALEHFYNDTGRYPIANYSSINNVSGTTNKSWIPELVPVYISSLPRDPRKNTIPSQQYLYVSDGKSYKIIAHGTDDQAYVKKKFPALVDPVRPDFAYGFWSTGGDNY